MKKQILNSVTAYRLLISAAILIAYSLLFLSVAHGQTSEKILVQCKITTIKKSIFTLNCRQHRHLELVAILDIPAADWPEKWEGQREVGSMFPAQWLDGHLKVLATNKRSICKDLDQCKSYDAARKGANTCRCPMN